MPPGRVSWGGSPRYRKLNRPLLAALQRAVPNSPPGPSLLPLMRWSRICARVSGASVRVKPNAEIERRVCMTETDKGLGENSSSPSSLINLSRAGRSGPRAQRRPQDPRRRVPEGGLELNALRAWLRRVRERFDMQPDAGASEPPHPRGEGLAAKPRRGVDGPRHSPESNAGAQRRFAAGPDSADSCALHERVVPCDARNDRLRLNDRSSFSTATPEYS